MSRPARERRRTTGIWLLLLALTGISWWIGRKQMPDGAWLAHDPRAAGVVIVVLAFVKIRLVILDFMEVRNAPAPMRTVCELWVAAVCTAILILYRF